MPAISDSRSSGSDSVLVMMRGFARGSAERSQTWPRAFGETSIGRDHRAVPVVFLGAVVFEVRGAHVELDVGRRQARPRAREGADLGDRRAELAAAAQQPLRQRLRLVGPVERVLVGDLPDDRHERVVLEVAPDAGQLVARLTPAARSSSAAPMPDSSSSWGEPIAPADEHHLALGAHDLAPPRRRREPHADGAVALELDAQHR